MESSTAETDLAALARVRVVLCNTSHPGNIGGCARAMKTMGLQSLYLVNPRRFPDAEAQAMASRATDVLERAQVCSSLDQALAGTVCAVASTARHRDLLPAQLSPHEAAARLVQEAKFGPVALVLGAEKFGLTVEEVSRCSALTTIPANLEYSSLNLASAVQVFAYEIRQAAGDRNAVAAAGEEPASFDELELFYTHLEQTLIAIDFLDPGNPRRLMQRMRRLFARTRIEKEEMNILRGVLAHARKASKNS